MPRRHILSERQRHALMSLPTDEPSLLRRYTLADDDLEHIRRQVRRTEPRCPTFSLDLALHPASFSEHPWLLESEDSKIRKDTAALATGPSKGHQSMRARKRADCEVTRARYSTVPRETLAPTTAKAEIGAACSTTRVCDVRQYE